MSGGVDSSVAAYLLKEAGYEVIGVFMRMGVEHENKSVLADDLRTRSRSCCSVEDALDARRVAEILDIPFRVMDFAQAYEGLMDHFVDEYRRGRTPNPCVYCNRNLKFGKLDAIARQLEARYVATGHYARLAVVRPDDQLVSAEREARGQGEVLDSTGGGAFAPLRIESRFSTPPSGFAAGRAEHDDVYLRTAVDGAKDQTYFLYALTAEQRRRCLFPVGDLDKSQVRAIAGRIGLTHVEHKAESMEICFVPTGDYRDVVNARAPEARRPGPLVDTDGRLLGEHQGVAQYTIGQRRGLGIALGQPRYVTALDPESNTVTLGTAEDLQAPGLLALGCNFIRPAAPAGEVLRVQARIRYNQRPVPATVEVLPEQAARVIFDRPERAVCPGQAVVFYDGEWVVGGGTIERALGVSDIAAAAPIIQQTLHA
ncbi:MAG: tRNA-specific 2-thiouridylase [Planctomycetes bacterium]|nr:tRNA-specific 2-thiouridylase [Planctomycetota bacterium]